MPTNLTPVPYDEKILQPAWQGVRVSVLGSAFTGGSQPTLAIASGETVAEATRRLTHPLWRSDEQLVAVLNGVPVDDPDERRLKDGDFLLVYPAYGVEALIAVGMFLLQTIVFAAFSYGLSLLMSKFFGPDKLQTDPGDDSGSATYGWSGPRTVYQQGSPIPVIYGKCQTGGQVISYYTENDGETSTLFILIFLSEGQIQSIGGSSEELNQVSGASIPPNIWVEGIQLRKKRKVLVSTRLGRLNQSKIPGFNDLTVEWPVNFELLYVKNSDRGLTNRTHRYRTHRAVRGVRMRIEYPEGLWESAGSEGTIYSVRADFDYRYRKVSGSTYYDWSDWTTKGQRERIRSSFSRDFRIMFDEVAEYEIEICRTSQRVDGFNGADKTVLGSVIEVQSSDLSYPRGALLGIEALATEGFNGATPQFRVECEGRVVRVWTGSEYEDAYSANPWWCALDYMQNTTYGLGDYMRNVAWPLEDLLNAATEADTLIRTGRNTKINQDSLSGTTKLMVDDATGFYAGDTIWVGYDTARFESLTVLEVGVGWIKTTTAFIHSHMRTQADQVSRVQEKYRCDGIVDRGGDAWEQVQQIARCARGSIIKVGNRLIVRSAMAVEPTFILNEGNTTNTTITYVNRRTQANEWRGRFLKEVPNTLWEPDTMTVLDEEAIVDAGDDTNYYSREGRRTEDIELWGVIRPEQARRDLEFRARFSRNSNKILKTEAPIEAIGAFPGRVFGFAHHVLGIQWNGRLAAAVSAGASIFTIDRAVTLSSGVTYKIHVIDSTGETVEKTVTSAAGSYARGANLSISPATFTNALETRAPYAMGPVGSDIEWYEVVAWKQNKDFKIELQGIKYDEANFVEAEHAA